jgi:hypothetical protein
MDGVDEIDGLAGDDSGLVVTLGDAGGIVATPEVDAGSDVIPMPTPDAGPPVEPPVDGGSIAVLPDAGMGVPGIPDIPDVPDIPGVACQIDEVQPILECGFESCAMSASAAEIGTCMLTNCGLLFLTISSECRGCLLSAISMDLTMISSACLTATTM